MFSAAVPPAVVIVCLHHSDGRTALAGFCSSSVHRFGTTQTQLEAIWRQWLVTAPGANLQILSGVCLSFKCRWLNDTCLPLPLPSPTHTHAHTHAHSWASANSIQCRAPMKLIRMLGNDSANIRSWFLMVFSITEDFPLSHACLFFFQIAGKDINNIILPLKSGEKFTVEGLINWIDTWAPPSVSSS